MLTSQAMLYFGFMPILTFLWGLRAWLKDGQDPKYKGLTIPEYASPVGLSPAEVGVLDDYRSADREVTATIIDLTIRGYIRVHQVAEKRLIGSGYRYEFELLRDDVLDLKEHEQKIIDGLFGVYSAKQIEHIQKSVTNVQAKQELSSQYPAGTVSLIGKTVSLSEIQPYFYKRVYEMHESLFSSLTGSGHFPSNPLHSPILMPVVSFCLIVAAVIVRGPTGIGLCLSALPLIFFSILMKARSKKGQKAKEYIDGFRMYLQTAEKDRIASLQGPHGAEIENFSEVHLYEHFLPYAVALGLENEWTSQFRGAYTEQPAWLDAATKNYEVSNITSISEDIKELLINNEAKLSGR